jgi:hypothetical protein
MREWRYSSSILDLRSRWMSASRPSRFTSGKRPPVPIGLDRGAGWAPEPVWKPWRKEKSLASTWNRTQPSSPSLCIYKLFETQLNVFWSFSCVATLSYKHKSHGIETSVLYRGIPFAYGPDMQLGFRPVPLSTLNNAQKLYGPYLTSHNITLYDMIRSSREHIHMLQCYYVNQHNVYVNCQYN